MWHGIQVDPTHTEWGRRGKYDLALSPNHDPEKLRAIPAKPEQGATGVTRSKVPGPATEKAKVWIIVGYTVKHFFSQGLSLWFSTT